MLAIDYAIPCSSGSELSPPEPLRKTFEGLRAHAMWFHGYSLRYLEGDGGQPMFLATRGAATFPFGHLVDVETWLKRLDAEAAEAQT